MAGLARHQRDLDRTRHGLERWFREHWLGRDELSVSPFRADSTGGFSSETLMFDVSWRDGGADHRAGLVLRLPPTGGGIFRDYELGKQSRAQQIAFDNGIRVPRQMAYEPDSSWLEAPFMLMELVPGRVPPNQPPYCAAGWLRDEPPERQSPVCRTALAEMAALHRIDVAATGASDLARAGGSGLDAELDWWSELAVWNAGGVLPAEVAHLRAWCLEHRPATEPAPAICWGDARIGNTIVGDDMRVAALIDWEMVTLCPPEVDLGWFLAYRTDYREQYAVGDPELPGFPSRAESIAVYESALGRHVDDIDWYELFAMFRLAAIRMGVDRIVREHGDADHFSARRPLVRRWVLDRMERVQ